MPLHVQPIACPRPETYERLNSTFALRNLIAGPSRTTSSGPDDQCSMPSSAHMDLLVNPSLAVSSSFCWVEITGIPVYCRERGSQHQTDRGFYKSYALLQAVTHCRVCLREPERMRGAVKKRERATSLIMASCFDTRVLKRNEDASTTFLSHENSNAFWALWRQKECRQKFQSSEERHAAYNKKDISPVFFCH